MSDHLARLRLLFQTHRKLRQVSYPAFPSRAWLVAQRRLLQLQARHYAKRGGGRMTHVLSVYWAPGHQRPTDIDYMTRLQPPAIRVLDPDPNQLVIAHGAAPNALILPRDWALSEQHDDVARDPIGTGVRHAQDWRGKIDRWQLPIPSDQIVVVGINEPRVWTMLPQVVEYNVAMLDECTRLGLRACALNLSVGWPANNGEGTPPDWTPYAPIEAAIKRGNHILVVHSYWYKSGPQDGAGWWAWRHRACPWDVPIIIGEAGVDLYVDMQRWQNDGKPNRGWRGNISPDQYAAQMEQYARGCDTRVIAILPFLTDYRSNNWESFDTAEAHPHFLARKDAMVPQVAPATKEVIHLPQIESGSTPAYVNAPAGLNLRAEPNAKSEIITAIPYGEEIALVNEWQGDWVGARYDEKSGWVYSKFLSGKPIEQPSAPTPPEPPEKPVGDEWARSRAFVAKWEGDYQNNPADKGNWTGCEVGKGENRGTKYGISACSYPDLDVRNLSIQEADAIYERDYWRASGADKLPWPYCLLVFDTAVLHGVGTARKWQEEVGADAFAFAAKRLRVYTKLDNWQEFGKGWVNRVSDLLEEASK